MQSSKQSNTVMSYIHDFSVKARKYLDYRNEENLVQFNRSASVSCNWNCYDETKYKLSKFVIAAALYSEKSSECPFEHTIFTGNNQFFHRYVFNVRCNKPGLWCVLDLSECPSSSFEELENPADVIQRLSLYGSFDKDPS